MHASSDRDRTLADPRAARYIWQRELGYTMWTVELRLSGKVIGACGFFPLEGTGPGIELAYHFAREYWGNGYATEAAAACLAFGLEGLGFERVVGITFSENSASRRVLEKIGMTYAGIQRFYDTDACVYEIAGNERNQPR